MESSKPAPVTWDQFVENLEPGQRRKVTGAFGFAIRKGRFSNLDELQEDMLGEKVGIIRIPRRSRAFLIIACWPVIACWPDDIGAYQLS